MAKMKVFEERVTTDQNELRDKMKIQAERTDNQMNALNAKIAGLLVTIEAQAAQTLAMQNTVTNMSNRMESFIAQQIQQATDNTALHAASSAQQTRMFEMLEAMEARAPSGEAHDKKLKVTETSWLASPAMNSDNNNNNSPTQSNSAMANHDEC